ncbi:hypothetical protein DO97_06010 [Neosynechococcus sphagnicola sy1]|uniref:Uncharacterized protein n=2 Tax=Neosynechococcus TaxID=1501143 RepID=A0A098TPU5_9CYAN|nr:hypothetical protein DO97_06010 [Neosynechococcus sphagnicola sy1]
MGILQKRLGCLQRILDIFDGGRLMPLAVLVLLLASGGLLTKVLIVWPLSWLEWLQVPGWLSLGLLFFVFSWCFAE